MEISPPIQAYSDTLRQICPELNSDEIAFMCTRVEIVRLEANALYLKAGEIQKSIAFSFQGLLRSFYINDKGQQITIDFTKENTYAADYDAFIKQKPSKYYIEALEPCSIVNVPFTAIQECYTKFKNCEKFGRRIAEIHLSKVQNRINSFLFYNAEQRYLHFVSRNKNIVNRISQEHLSSFLGVKRQTLTRIRKKIIQSL